MSKKHIAVLGGGPAGLAVGYYAKKNKIPFRVYEASDQIGGITSTLEHKGFLFDSGAHRFHDKYPEITADIKNLMKGDIRKINVPSQIYHNGKLIDFPLSPLNIVKNLGIFTCAKAGFELIFSRLKGKSKNKDFRSFALHTYSGAIAKRFLLNYSEKLWGKPSNRLSPGIAGKRMKGLTLKTFIMEALLGKNAKTEHLDGAFYYPVKGGIGNITKRLAEFCGKKNIAKNSKITKIIHKNKQITGVELNGKKKVKVKEVVTTLPVTLFLQMMNPKPSKEILDLAKSLNHRDMMLVALFLNKKSISKNASVYFPSHKFTFTRLYEPRNRNPVMSPQGKTSLVFEIPCQDGSRLWKMKDKELIRLISSQIMGSGWIKKSDIIDSLVTRFKYTYPILELGYEEKIKKVMNFLKEFTNLKISGRNGMFMYSHIHDMMKFGKDIVESY